MTTYASRRWIALSDPTRRSIFERLITRPQAVGQLARTLPVSRPAVSQHLKVLKKAGLVTERAVGRQHVYSVSLEGLAAFRADMERFWNRAMATYKEVVEEAPEEDE